MRSLLSRFVTTASTIYKQRYDQPLTVVLDPDNPQAESLTPTPTLTLTPTLRQRPEPEPQPQPQP